MFANIYKAKFIYFIRITKSRNTLHTAKISDVIIEALQDTFFI